MSLPEPGLSVPTLLNDQLSFNGITMGNPPNTPFGWVKLEGVGKAKVRSNNIARAQGRGQFVGLNLLDARTITLTMDIGPPFGSYSTLAGTLAALVPALSTEGVTEYPLWIQVPNLPMRACMARVTGFDPPWDIVADLGSLISQVPLQWTAADPYFYSAPTISTTIGLSAPAAGFGFPLGFNLSFGSSVNPNQAVIPNAGNVPCYPVIIITGPCLNPSVQNTSLPGNPVLEFNTQLNSGDQLVIDCDLGSVVFYPAGQTDGEDAQELLMAGSSFFAIAPNPTAPNGTNYIAFNSQDTTQVAGTCQIWSASAYDGLLG